MSVTKEEVWEEFKLEAKNGQHCRPPKPPRSGSVLPMTSASFPILQDKDREQKSEPSVVSCQVICTLLQQPWHIKRALT